MAWSLLNSMLAERVNAILDEAGQHYGPEQERAMSRDKASQVIHAALWAHSSRIDGTAGAYAHLNLFHALGLKGWTFDDEEQAILVAHRTKKAGEQRVAWEAQQTAARASEAE